MRDRKCGESDDCTEENSRFIGDSDSGTECPLHILERVGLVSVGKSARPLQSTSNLYANSHTGQALDRAMAPCNSLCGEAELKGALVGLHHRASCKFEP